MLVMTNIFLLRQKKINIILLQQKLHHDKHNFVATKVLSQQAYFCHDKDMFCPDKDVFCHDNCCCCGSSAESVHRSEVKANLSVSSLYITCQ